MLVVRSTDVRLALAKLQNAGLNDTDKLTYLDRFIRLCVEQKDFTALNDIVKELVVNGTTLLLLQVMVRRLMPFKAHLNDWDVFLEDVYLSFKMRGMCLSYFVPELKRPLDK